MEHSPVAWLSVENLARSFLLVHDQVELDGDRKEDENAELLKADAAHVEMNAQHLR